jgi:hypothetical protein
MGSDADQKPKRLYFKTYLQLVHNSVGTGMFRNFYVQTADGQELDGMDGGSNSCAFYVSAVLTIVKRLSGVHGTVASVIRDLQQSGWVGAAEKDLQAGDVIIWEPQEYEGKMQRHIGFYIGDGRAVSTSWTKKVVVEHDVSLDGRAIEQIFRQPNWR